MYDNTFPASPLPEPPPPEPEVRKHSRLGIASFVLSIVSLGLVCLFFIFAYVLGTNTSMASSSGVSVVGWVFICGIGLSTLAGVGLGIAAVVKPAQSKVFGILGIIFNALIMLGFCLFILIAVFAAASVLGY